MPRGGCTYQGRRSVQTATRTRHITDESSKVKPAIARDLWRRRAVDVRQKEIFKEVYLPRPPVYPGGDNGPYQVPPESSRQKFLGTVPTKAAGHPGGDNDPYQAQSVRRVCRANRARPSSRPGEGRIH